MTLEVQCPLCGRMMEPLPDTEGIEGGFRIVDMLCPICCHRETVNLGEEHRDSSKSV